MAGRPSVLGPLHRALHTGTDSPGYLHPLVMLAEIAGGDVLEERPGLVGESSRRALGDVR